MQRFDIEYFKRHAVDDELSITADDGTITTRLRYRYGYTERIRPPSGYFDTYREFQPDGRLRVEGALFKKGDFRAGVWQEYRDDGSLQRRTDYDAPFRLSVDRVIEIARQQKAAFSMSDDHSRILRMVQNGHPAWIVEWKEAPGRVERIVLDDETARVIRRDAYPFHDDQ